jgi:hypothetical protein
MIYKKIKRKLKLARTTFFITMFNTKCFNKPYIVCAILDSNVLLMMYDTKAANGAGAA